MSTITVNFYNSESNDRLYFIQLSYFPVFIKGQAVRFLKQGGSKIVGSVVSTEQSFSEWECGSMEGTSHYLKVFLAVDPLQK